MPEDRDNSEQLRTQAALLVSQARAQADELGQALAAINSAAPVHAQLSAASSQLSDVIRQLTSALQSKHFPLRPADLMALQGRVSSGEVRALVAEAKTAQADPVRMQAVATASAATRTEVQRDVHDIFERKIFEPYLHFGSRQDEEEFRKREVDAKRYIQQQLAKNTPEGNLNAAGGEQSYLLDAHAHGAGASPEFKKRFDALSAKTAQQHDAMRAAGQSTAEYDQHVQQSVRRYLKQTGVPEAEIEDRIAHAAHPIDAAGISAPAKQGRAAGISGPAKPAQVDLIDKVAAKLKAAGVQMGDDTSSGHGLAGVGSGKAQEDLARAP